MASGAKGDARKLEKDGASPGKIFVGGLAKDTSLATYAKHFGKYGEMTDYVIMKDKVTNHPRGFGFVTYADPSVVDKVINDPHIINGKQVEIKRTIPKDTGSKDFKTKIFVGGLPPTYAEDELKNFFSGFGKVVEHQIICDHQSDRSRGFGFVTFDSEQAVDDLLAKGNMIDLAGTQVEIKKAEPKKPSKQPSAFGIDSRALSFGDNLGGFGNSYSSFGSGGFGPTSYRTSGGFGARLGGYGGGAGEFGVGYGGFGGGSLAGYQGAASLGYSSRYGSGYGGGYRGGLGGYGSNEIFGGYGGSGFGSSYASSPGAGYGFGPLSGGRSSYGSAGRYNPYAR